MDAMWYEKSPDIVTRDDITTDKSIIHAPRVDFFH